MKAIPFAGQTHDLGAPQGWDDATHGPCASLPVKFDPSIGFESVWELTRDEFEKLLDGGKLRLRIYSASHPPVALWIE
jgi:hypothetical protein